MMTRHLGMKGIVAGVLLAAGCDARTAAHSSSVGAAHPLRPLAVSAPLPAGAKVEDLSRPGMPRRVNVTSVEPELIFDLEEVDALSPSHADVLKLAASATSPAERAEVRENQHAPDGTFQILVVHTAAAPGVGRIQSFTVDSRVRAGERFYDCSGTASSMEAAQRLIAACQAVRAS